MLLTVLKFEHLSGAYFTELWWRSISAVHKVCTRHLQDGLASMTPGCWLLVWWTLTSHSILWSFMEWSHVVPSGCQPHCRNSFVCQLRQGHG